MIFPYDLKNFLLNDPLIDYLKENPKYSSMKNKKSNYTSYLESKKWKFTQECINYFKGQYSQNEILDLSLVIDFKDKCDKTKEALKKKGIHCIIYGGLSKGNQGAVPELLIRLKGNFHVLDIRLMSCYYCKDNITLKNNPYLWYCKTRLYMMNNLLPKPQKLAYIAARKIGDKTYKEHLIFIEMSNTLKQRYNDALEWVNKLQINKNKWKLEPPSVKELFPNMKVKNEEWNNVKKELAIKLKEISLVWNITTKQRQKLHSKGIFSWNDPRLFNTLQTKKTIPNTLNIQKKFINMNSSTKDTYPTIKNEINVDILNKKNYVSFFVDFETVMDLDENSTQCNINMTFMIGCIAVVNGKSSYKDFTVSRLTDIEEKKIFIRWIEYMNRISNKHNALLKDVPIYHWSPAEKTFYKAAANKHLLEPIDSFKWIDMFQIFKREPITLKNAWAFGLKNIAKVLYDNGEIKTTWSVDDATDGQDAMVRVIKCNEKADIKNVPLKRFEEMHQIITYNYVDCQVLYEILECIKKYL